MQRAGATGAWSVSIPPPAGLISTRPEPEGVRRGSHSGVVGQFTIDLMRAWADHAVGSPARSMWPAKAGDVRSRSSSQQGSGVMHRS
jgi:hypothetical protein